MLIRLGKQEHMITKGHGFWTPFDCLHAITVLPGATFYKVAFSVRMTQPLCTDAGFRKRALPSGPGITQEPPHRCEPSKK